MKNVVLGLIETGMFLYMLLMMISIYSITTRKNELSNMSAQLVEDTLMNFCGSNSTSEEVERYLKDMAGQRLQADSRWNVEVTSMDLEKGLLGVALKEDYFLPNGFHRSIVIHKTAIVEQLEKEPVIWR